MLQDKYSEDPYTHEFKENALGRLLVKQQIKTLQGRTLTILEAAFPDGSRQLNAVTELLKQEYNKVLLDVDKLCLGSPGTSDETNAVILSANGVSIGQVTYSTIVTNHKNRNK